ncbi:DUF4156 domain-containing protein [Stenotrophomonas geniculata]|uniref:DUF4156 domain-containing protein n=1 Tax=Stenotrophomonas geniculata TaxID=86188 RepID=UPI003AAD28BF
MDKNTRTSIHITLLATVSTLLLGACSSLPSTPESAGVRITNNEPVGCRFIGDITGNQGNLLLGQFTSNKNLETGARNDLKNQAVALGGNVVYLLTQRAGTTGNGTYIEQTNVTLAGNVYRCP